MKTLFSLAWRNIWRNKKRSLITISSILIAVFLAIGIRSMQLGMYKSLLNNIIDSYTGYVQIHGKNYWNERTIDNALEINDELYKTIKETEGVKEVIPRLGSFCLASFDDLTKGVLVNGIVPEKESAIQNIEERIIEGRIFSKNNEVVLAKDVASYFQVSLGDTIVFLGQGYHGMSAAAKYIISGIIDLKNPNLNKLNVFLSLNSAQELFSAPNVLTNIVIAKDEHADADDIKANLISKLDTNALDVMSWKEMMPEIEQTIAVDSAGGIIMIAILYMIIFFGIFGTVLMMTQERMYEFGVLVSIGMKKWKLVITVLIETVMLSLAGVIGGILFVYPFILWKHFDPFQFPKKQAAMMEKFGFSPEIPFYILPDLPIAHSIIIFVITIVVALYPTYVLLRLKPLDAMRR